MEKELIVWSLKYEKNKSHGPHYAFCTNLTDKNSMLDFLDRLVDTGADINNNVRVKCTGDYVFYDSNGNESFEVKFGDKMSTVVSHIPRKNMKEMDSEKFAEWIKAITGANVYENIQEAARHMKDEDVPYYVTGDDKSTLDRKSKGGKEWGKIITLGTVYLALAGLATWYVINDSKKQDVEPESQLEQAVQDSLKTTQQH